MFVWFVFDTLGRKELEGITYFQSLLTLYNSRILWAKSLINHCLIIMDHNHGCLTSVAYTYNVPSHTHSYSPFYLIITFEGKDLLWTFFCSHQYSWWGLVSKAVVLGDCEKYMGHGDGAFLNGLVPSLRSEFCSLRTGWATVRVGSDKASSTSCPSICRCPPVLTDFPTSRDMIQNIPHCFINYLVSGILLYKQKTDKDKV